MNGTSFCPTLSNPGSPNPASNEWNLNVTVDKSIVKAVADAGYNGAHSPGYLFLESSNEAEHACYAKWGYRSAATPGVAKALGHMYAKTMPAVLHYARTALGISAASAIGYVGESGGPAHGDTCVTSTKHYGYTCTYKTARVQVNDFNNTVKSDGAAAPFLESVHSYCHSPDFTSAAGYSVPNNECYAYMNQWIQMARSRVDSIWGRPKGGNIAFAVSEWQAGVCTGTTDATCWSGFQNGAGNDTNAYDKGFLSMLKGNGQTFGARSTRYWLGVMFDAASNADGTGLSQRNGNLHPGGNYNVINETGTKGEGYSAFCKATTIGSGC